MSERQELDEIIMRWISVGLRTKEKPRFIPGSRTGGAYGGDVPGRWEYPQWCREATQVAELDASTEVLDALIGALLKLEMVRDAAKIAVKCPSKPSQEVSDALFKAVIAKRFKDIYYLAERASTSAIDAAIKELAESYHFYWFDCRRLATWGASYEVTFFLIQKGYVENGLRGANVTAEFILNRKLNPNEIRRLTA